MDFPPDILHRLVRVTRFSFVLSEKEEDTSRLFHALPFHTLLVLITEIGGFTKGQVGVARFRSSKVAFPSACYKSRFLLYSFFSRQWRITEGREGRNDATPCPGDDLGK